MPRVGKDLAAMDFKEVEKLAKEGVPDEDMFKLWKIDERYWKEIRKNKEFAQAYSSGQAYYRIEMRKKLNLSVTSGDAAAGVITLLGKNVLGLQDKPEAPVQDNEIVITGSGKLAKVMSKNGKNNSKS